MRISQIHDIADNLYFNKNFRHIYRTSLPSNDRLLAMVLHQVTNCIDCSNMDYWASKMHNTVHLGYTSFEDAQQFLFKEIWTASSEFGTYRLCEQRRFRRACASAQSRQNLRCSLIQAVSQEEPSDRKPDPWPLWMAGHAQLKFVMTVCSKTQIRLTRLIRTMFVDLSVKWTFYSLTPLGALSLCCFLRSMYYVTCRIYRTALVNQRRISRSLQGIEVEIMC